MKIIYIAGSGRSGSTLLSVLLSQGSDVINVGQSRSFFRVFQQNVPCSCGETLQSCTVWSKVAAKFSAGEPATTTLMKVKKRMNLLVGDMAEPASVLMQTKKLMNQFFSASRNLTDWGDERQHKELAAGHRQFINELGRFLRMVTEVTDAEILVDSSKSPELALALSLVDGVDIWVLNLVRDPRAVATSWEKKSGRSMAMKQTTEWAYRQKVLEQWSQILAERSKVVKYEDFTAAPQDTVNDILRWAGAEREIVFTSQNHAEVNWARQHLYPPANETFLAEKRSNIDVVESTSWNDAKHAKLHATVESMLAPSMTNYGYTPNYLND